MFKLIGKFIGPWKVARKAGEVTKDSGDFIRTVAEWVTEVDRNARAYGWEVGKGSPQENMIHLSVDNPFGRTDLGVWDNAISHKYNV